MFAPFFCSRYGNMRFGKQSRQKMFAIWAKKEHRNLLRLYRAGVPCPEPLKQREHTLVLSFIGKDHWPAPQLREIDLSKGNWRRFAFFVCLSCFGRSSCGEWRDT